MLKEYKVNLHVLEACNFRCFHCFSRFGSNKIMALEDWKKIVDNCMESQVVSEFNIAGGEPLLYKDLIGLVKIYQRKGREGVNDYKRVSDERRMDTKIRTIV